MHKLRKPTEKQIQLAESLGILLRSLSVFYLLKLRMPLKLRLLKLLRIMILNQVLKLNILV